MSEMWIVKKAIADVRSEFEKLQAEPAMRFEQEATWAEQILWKQEKVRTAAEKNLLSVQDALLNVAMVGVTLNPARKLAYLVPRDNSIVYDLSYLGLVELAVTLRVIRWAQAELVYTGEVFRRSGLDKAPVHEFDPFGDDRDNDDNLRGVYCVAKLHDGDFLTTSMKISEVWKIRDKSKGIGSEHSPWKAHPGEMVKKTVIKRAAKLWKTSDAVDNPVNNRLDRAIDYLNTDNGEGINFEEPGTPALVQPKTKPSNFIGATGTEPPLDQRRDVSGMNEVPPPSAIDRMRTGEREPGQDDEVSHPPAPTTAPKAAPPAADNSGAAQPGQKAWIRNKTKELGLDLQQLLAEHSIGNLDALTNAQFAVLRKNLSAR